MPLKRKKHYNPRRRRPAPKRRNAPKKNQSQYAVAKRVAMNMIPMKRCPNDGIATLGSSSPNSLLIKPYFIEANQTLASGADELHKRNGNQVHVYRTSGIFRIEIPATCVNHVDVRQICGWYKGTGATVAQGNGPPGTIANLTATHLAEVFTSNIARYDPSNFKIISDRSFIRMPESIYDLDGPNGQGTTMVGLWKPVTLKCNFRFNKRFRYADGKQNDDSEITTNGEQLLGWKPFIWVYVKSPDQQWSQGNACDIQYKFTTYFKDLN